MSADNEVAVVKFPDNSYRVAEISGCPDMNDDWFITAYYESFNKSFFNSYQDAMNHAHLLEEKLYICEYGITFYEAKKSFEEYNPLD